MISVTAGSAFFDGVCYECRPPESSDQSRTEHGAGQGEKGQVVTNVHVAGCFFTLCATHTNKLIESLSRAGVRRDI